VKPDSNNGYRSPATGFLLACIFAATASAQPSLDALLDGEIGSLVATYKRLHAAPELSHYEENTAAFFAGQLRAMGYTVTERVGKFDRPEWVGYGVVAVMKNGDGPSVLVRTDLDALPIEEKTGLAYASKVKTRNDAGQEVGVMHACGHDIHITTMLGVARIMATLKDQWQGTLVLIGQPAEETIDGARAMLKDGLYARFPRPAYALALHDNPEFATGHVACVPGYALASANSVDIKIRGVGGHGSRPEAAKDPVVLAAEVVMALQTIVSRENSPLDPAVITVGSIHGGTRYNIIPDEVNLQLTVRAFKEEVRQKLLAAIERVTKGLALAAGLAAQVNDPARVVGRLGPDDQRRVVGARVIDHEDPQRIARVVKPHEPVYGYPDHGRLVPCRNQNGRAGQPLTAPGIVQSQEMQDHQQVLVDPGHQRNGSDHHEDDEHPSQIFPWAGEIHAARPAAISSRVRPTVAYTPTSRQSWLSVLATTGTPAQTNALAVRAEGQAHFSLISSSAPVSLARPASRASSRSGTTDSLRPSFGRMLNRCAISACRPAARASAPAVASIRAVTAAAPLSVPRPIRTRISPGSTGPCSPGNW